MNHDRIADISAGASWTLFGVSVTQLNEALTTISLICAIACSIAATLYYIGKNRRKSDD